MIMPGLRKTFYAFEIILFVFHIDICPGTTAKSINSTNGAIKDLSVKAVPFDREALQVNITWTPMNLHSMKLDVRLQPLSNGYCPIRPCVAYGLSPTITDILLPADPMPFLEHRECTVEPGCTYDVYVETADRTIQSKLRYTVPECVGEICSCKHVHNLPNTFVGANLESTKLKIYWNITTPTAELLESEIHVDSVFISVGIQKNPTLTWGGRYKNITEIQMPLYDGNGTLLREGFYEVQLVDPIVENSQYVVRAHVVDSYGCHGADGNFTYFVVPRKATTEMSTKTAGSYQWIFSIVFASTIFLLVASFVYAFRHVLKRRRKKNSIQNWRGVYHNVPTGGVVPHIVMQENFFYVDKDILEARARGEADLLEVPHSCLTIGREIGKGAFGRVYIARADNINGMQGSQVVAVKQLKKRPSPDELEEFLSEIATMKTVSKHPNVVSLIGCCTIRQPLLMIMEYIGYGDLLQYLRQVRAKHEARSIVVSGVINPQQQSNDASSSTTLIANNNDNSCVATSNNSSAVNNMGPLGKYLELLHNSFNSSSGTSNSDVSYVTRTESASSNLRASLADTMYTMLSHNPALASSSYSTLEYVLDHKELHNFAIQIARGMRHLEARQITHRDLAARNILIDEHKTLKISDFGLSRTGIYVNTRNKKVPLRWLSLEAMRDNLYSSKSDVWAFGVVLWEIGTLGGFPYPTVGNHELLAYLSSGQRLQRPENCSEPLYELMKHCWMENPEDRPYFSDIVTKLEPAHQRIYVDFNDLGPNYVFPPTTEDMLAKLKENDKNSHRL